MFKCLEEYLIERSEEILLLLFLIVSIYMFIGTFSFSHTVALFPRLGSSFIILSSIILLYRSVGLNHRNNEGGDEENLNEESEKLITESEYNRVYVVLLGFGYMVLSFLIGLQWATPIFIVVYMLRFDKSISVTMILAIIGFLIVYMFNIFLNIPVGEGILG